MSKFSSDWVKEEKRSFSLEKLGKGYEDLFLTDAGREFLALADESYSRLKEKIEKLQAENKKLRGALEKINLTTEPYSYAVAEEALKELEDK